MRGGPAGAPIALRGDSGAASVTRSSAALRALVDGGELTLPDGVPAAVTIERPRQQGHGDYATNVALQLAKKAGTNPRDLATLIAERLQETEGIADVEVAGPGFLNITVDAGAQGQVAAGHRGGGGGVRTLRSARGRADQPRVRLGEPDGAAAPRGHALGGGGGRAGADLRRRRGPRSRGSTTSTTTGRRSTCSRGRCWRRRGARRCRRTGTAASTSPTSPTRSPRSGPTRPSCRTRRRRRSTATSACG